MLVSVITATTGNPLLEPCARSVARQTYPDVEHVIVIDGAERRDPTERVLQRLAASPRRKLACLPYPTGKNEFFGHRVYGAFSFLVDGDLIIFLDEDNWFDEDHVSSLVEAIRQGELDWAYALRKIVDAEGRFLMRDDCESLGQWPTYLHPSDHLVDVSCYCLRRELALTVAPVWYSQGRNTDRRVCQTLLQLAPRVATTGQYTVNYRTGPTGVQPAFFERGNAMMAARYPHGFPWARSLTTLPL